jgi:uncharacterized protein YjbI with pentapeptide repeats
MRITPPEGRLPPARILRLLIDHQRWLNSKGQFGAQLDRDELLFDACDLRGVDLSGALLSDACFRGGSLRGARFVGAELPYVVFPGCDLEGADFSNSRLCDATFIANHEKACFDGANLDRVAWNEEHAKRRSQAHPDRSYFLLRQPRL